MKSTYAGFCMPALVMQVPMGALFWTWITWMCAPATLAVVSSSVRRFTFRTTSRLRTYVQLQ